MIQIQLDKYKYKYSWTNTNTVGHGLSVGLMPNYTSGASRELIPVAKIRHKHCNKRGDTNGGTNAGWINVRISVSFNNFKRKTGVFDELTVL